MMAAGNPSNGRGTAPYFYLHIVQFGFVGAHAKFQNSTRSFLRAVERLFLCPLNHFVPPERKYKLGHKYSRFMWGLDS